MEWSELGGNTIMIAFDTDGSIRGFGWDLEFQCKDQFQLPTCSQVDSDMGTINYVPHDFTEFLPITPINQITSEKGETCSIKTDYNILNRCRSGVPFYGQI